MVNSQNKKIAVIISYFTMLVQFAVVFFITPYLLKQLGDSEYGLYQLVASTASYLTLLGFGFSAAYIRFYSRFKSNNEEEKIASLNGMFMTLFLIMSISCIIIGAIVCSNINVVLGDKLEVDQYSEAKRIFFLLALNMALTFPKSIFVCNTTAHEKFVFQKSLVLSVDVLTPILQIVFVVFLKNGFALTLATTAATLFDFIINILYNVYKLRMRFKFGNFDWPLLKEISIFTFFIFLNQVLDLLSSTNIDNYLIGRIIGTTSVTIYSMGSKISQMFHSVAAPISAVFVPTVYRLVEEKKSNEQLSALFTKVGKIQFIILYLIISGFVLWGKPFINIWIGEGYGDSYYIAIVLMASLVVALSQNIGIEIQRAVNKHKVRSIVYLVIDIGNVFISIPLIRWLGPIGAAVGTAIAMLLGTVIFMNWYYKVGIGIAISGYWKNVLQIILCSLPAIIVARIMIKILGTGILTTILQALVYVIIYAITIYLAVLDQKEKDTVNIIKRIRRSVK